MACRALLDTHEGGGRKEGRKEGAVSREEGREVGRKGGRMEVEAKEDSGMERRGRSPEQNIAGAKKGKRRRRLRKRSKSRGHGTLNENDLMEPKTVDCEELNLSEKSFGEEFGNPGMLPEKYRDLRTLMTTLKPKTTEVIGFQMSEGDYIVTIKHKSRFPSPIGASKSIQGKAWLNNTKKRYSITTYAKVLRPNDRTWELHFSVPRKDRYALQLLLTSQSSMHTLKVITTVQKTNSTGSECTSSTFTPVSTLTSTSGLSQI